MKALSVKNPFAGLIAHGLKRYEVRTFKTKYRGPLVICSSKKSATNLYQYYKSIDFGLDFWESIEAFKIDEVPNGHALAIVDLVDVIPYEGTREQQSGSYTELEALQEYFGQKQYYLWKLENARLIEPVPVKGQLGIFNIELPVTELSL